MNGPKRSPLHEEHLKLDAKMAPYAGWEMPIYYSGIIEEYRLCRQKAAVFDISHMGEIIFKGDLKGSGLDFLFTSSLEDILTGRAKYTLILNEKGGIIDDLIVFKISSSELMIVTNASRRVAVFSHLKDNINGGVLEDISDFTAKIDLQGPYSGKIVENIVPEVKKLSYFKFTKAHFGDSEIIVSRTGYTGELGYEFFLPAEKSPGIWNLLLNGTGAGPAGLGARNILRLEMGYSLYGNEIDENTNPIESGLEFAIDYSSSFLGKNALLKIKEKGAARKKVAFATASRRAPKEGWKIVAGGRNVGIVTSGSFSPALSRGIGMGYLESGINGIKTIILTGERGINLDAEITDIPFYRKGTLRN